MAMVGADDNYSLFNILQSVTGLPRSAVLLIAIVRLSVRL